MWCSQYYRKSDLFEDDLAEFDHSREADAPPCPPHPQTRACFCVGTAAARARAAQPLLYSAAQPHCAREVTARARSRIAHARTHARAHASLQIVTELIDEYKACETPDYIEWGMRVAAAAAPVGSSERMPGDPSH